MKFPRRLWNWPSHPHVCIAKAAVSARLPYVFKECEVRLGLEFLWATLFASAVASRGCGTSILFLILDMLQFQDGSTLWIEKNSKSM